MAPEDRPVVTRVRVRPQRRPVEPVTTGIEGAATPAATAVSVRGLRRSFGPKVAVAGIDLDVPSGSFFGLVGPNGAGKTTTLKMITGLLRPHAGSVRVAGVDV